MTKEYSGGCQCGAVRFRVAGPPVSASICHCRMCQKAFGNYFAALVTFKIDQIIWTRAKPAIFKSSSFAKRGFCADCGTPLSYQWNETNMAVAIGAFDTPDLFKPARQYAQHDKIAHFDDAIGAEFVPFSENPEEIEFLNNIVNHQHPDHDTTNWPLKKEQHHD